MASRARPPLRILAGDRVLPGGAHRGDPPRGRRHLLPGHHRPRLLRSAPLPGAGAVDAAPLRGVGTDGGAGSDRGEAAILTTHNTFTKRKEPFAPLEEGTARLYVCGPNLYGPVHVGHAFSYAFFDVVRRYLEYRGYRVIHVQNFTDIEDRIIERAGREGRTIFDIAQEYIDRFFQEMDALGIRRAHHYPRASEVIPQIIEIIQGLIARGHAHAAGRAGGPPPPAATRPSPPAPPCRGGGCGGGPPGAAAGGRGARGEEASPVHGVG